METKALLENLQALMTALTMKLIRVAVSSTMSPGVKVKIA
jgi:ribosomal protein L1